MRAGVFSTTSTRDTTTCERRSSTWCSGPPSAPSTRGHASTASPAGAGYGSETASGSPIRPRSAWTNRLIKEGAAIVTSVDDIFEALSITTAPEEDNDAQKGKREIAGDELLIWKALRDDALHIDDIAGMTGLSAAKASALLLQMELKGLVRQETGKRFSKGRARS